MDIILTISLLASNRRESLERCLDSLKPLLVKIPSELIIVFTGTDKKVLEIAQKYTPQIITFEWCNDFSAARNIGLEAAQGSGSCTLMTTNGLMMWNRSASSS
ncbi:glycosyltransferase [Lachnospiraceae bacterium WCA-9-b2]|uniref:Glycosyltransferase n=1 Tax=Sporofaciens musculi TaxID=2681861 RepID=A0A7X3MCK9_9FIRM|nr:glycosyltransferase [Sporofaciens musculi]MXP73926.1 glycosyltransferase [Sporofaciens musculi]